MATSDRKRQANQNNARLSTGPRSSQGKAKASGNATRHGLLSRKLILPGESQAEFDALLTTLLAEMQPLGTVEHVLVERVATTMWRQRRLVAAESAQLNLSHYEDNNLAVGKVLAAARLQEDDAPMVADLLKTPCKLSDALPLLHELQALSGDETVSDICMDFPGLWATLCAEAECEGLEPVSQADQVTNYTRTHYKSLFEWVLGIKHHHTRYCRAVETVGWIRDRVALLPMFDTVSRYQSALDNELFKALRAFREAQSARLRQPVIDA